MSSPRPPSRRRTPSAPSRICAFPSSGTEPELPWPFESTAYDYKKAGVPPGRLKEWAAKAGWEKLVNARGPTWRKIPDKKKMLVGFDTAEFEKLR